MADRNEVESIFAGAVKLSGADLKAFLDQKCGLDGELRQKVESLLDVTKAKCSNAESRVIELEVAQKELEQKLQAVEASQARTKQDLEGTLKQLDISVESESKSVRDLRHVQRL